MLKYRQITAVTAQGAMVEDFQSNIVRHMTETLEASRHEIKTSVDRSIGTLEERIRCHVDRRIAATPRQEHNLIQESETDGHESAPISEDLVRRGKGHAPPFPTGNRLRIPRNNRSRCRCKCHSKSQGSVTRWEVAWLQYVLAGLGISYQGFTFTPSKDSDKEHLCTTCRGHLCC